MKQYQRLKKDGVETWVPVEDLSHYYFRGYEKVGEPFVLGGEPKQEEPKPNARKPRKPKADLE